MTENRKITSVCVNTQYFASIAGEFSDFYLSCSAQVLELEKYSFLVLSGILGHFKKLFFKENNGVGGRWCLHKPTLGYFSVMSEITPGGA